MRLAHDRIGEGPPLVLLHGIGMSRAVWRPVVPLLAREREVVAVDMPGFGASPPGPHTLRGLADAVAEFCDRLGWEHPHVAGNSLGGGVALILGAIGRARTVCALSPVGFAAGREHAYARAVLTATRLLAPATPILAGTRPARTLSCAYVAGRPWRIPREVVLQWVRAYAGSPSFWPLRGAHSAGGRRCRRARRRSPGASGTAC